MNADCMAFLMLITKTFEEIEVELFHDLAVTALKDERGVNGVVNKADFCTDASSKSGQIRLNRTRRTVTTIQ